jgi:hypothetical protein
VVRDINLLRKLPSQKAQQDYVYDEFLKISKKFSSLCWVCDSTMSMKTKRLGWALHHKDYIYGELTYRYFDLTKDEFMWKAKGWTKKDPKVLPSIKGIHMRSLYRLDVFRQVKKKKGNFLLFCSSHHYALEKLDQFAPPKVKKLIRAWKMTKTKWKYK